MPAAQLLIVDDDPELRRCLAGELEANGYPTVNTAAREVQRNGRAIHLTLRGVGFVLKAQEPGA
jgi:DNA-binding response OmpR family regulator